MLGKAEFSRNRRYRYTLWRDTIVPGPVREQESSISAGFGYVMFIGLNPSTADENTNDATLRRVIRFARDWGYARVVMTNLFAFRATDPREMKRCTDPVGPDNDRWLMKTAQYAAQIICAWGNHGAWQGRCIDVEIMLRQFDLYSLGLSNRLHQPLHPLRLPAIRTPILFRPKE